MKKNFSLTAPNRRPDRQVEFIKQEINKYLARERRKKLPDGVDFWDFNCKCGPTSDSAKAINVAELSKGIDQVVNAKAESVYIEILAKPGVRLKRS